MEIRNGFGTLEFQRTFCKARGLELIIEQVEIEDDIYRVMLFNNSSSKTMLTYNVGYSVIEPFPKSIARIDEIISTLKEKYPELSCEVRTVPMVDFDMTSNNKDFKVLKKLASQVLPLDKYRLYGEKMFKGSVRTDIRRSREHNLKLEECSTKEELEEFLEVFEEAKKHNNSTYKLDFNVLYDLLKYNNLFKLILVKDAEGKIISGSGFIFSETTIFYWFNANVFEKRYCRANYMILYHIISEYKDYDCINMGYSASKNIENFKKSWGAEDYYYYVLDRDVMSNR